jgi:hypothetical protein
MQYNVLVHCTITNVCLLMDTINTERVCLKSSFSITVLLKKNTCTVDRGTTILTTNVMLRPIFQKRFFSFLSGFLYPYFYKFNMGIKSAIFDADFESAEKM